MGCALPLFLGVIRQDIEVTILVEPRLTVVPCFIAENMPKLPWTWNQNNLLRIAVLLVRESRLPMANRERRCPQVTGIIRMINHEPAKSRFQYVMLHTC
jgi:hypothetical protein